MPEPRSLRLRLTALAVVATSIVATAQQAFRAAHVAPASGMDVRLVHHVADERVVAVAARDDRPEFETWEWDGGHWHQRRPRTSPPYRFGTSMAYDPSRRVVVLFGGTEHQSPHNADLWEWDGVDWTLRIPTAGPVPPGRANAAMAYDARRGRMIVHGGDTAGGRRADCWEWDGARWTERPTVATDPGPRAGHGMVFDSIRNVMVLHGGVGLGLPYLDDTYEDSGAGWVLRTPPTRPPALRGSTMSFDSGTGRCVVVGGQSLTGDNHDVWEWDGTQWQRTATGWSLGQRFGFGFAYDAARRRHVLHGGASVAETWLFDAAARNWTKVPFDAARPAYFGVAANDWNGRTLYVGANETLLYDHGSGVLQRLPGASPPPAYGMAMAFDVFRREAVLCISRPSAAVVETWIWSEATRSWAQRTNVAAPPAAVDASLAYDHARHRIVRFGGIVGGTPSALTHEWDGTTWTTPLVSSAPQARSGAGFAFDYARQRLVLFGGAGGVTGAAFGDVWEWDGVSWTQRTMATPGPGARQYPGIGARFNEIVVFGGDDGFGAIAGDVWALRGNQWVPLDTGTIPPFFAPITACDPLHDELVVLGGMTRTAAATFPWFVGGVWVHGLPRAVVVPFGGPCASSAGTPALSSRGRPTPGRTDYALDANGFARAQPAAFVFGGAPMFFALGPSCRSFVQPSVAFASTTDATGATSLPLPVPAALLGIDVRAFVQAFALDPAGSGFAATAALELRIGR